VLFSLEIYHAGLKLARLCASITEGDASSTLLEAASTTPEASASTTRTPCRCAITPMSSALPPTLSAQVVFSCTKGIAAICMGICANHGLLQAAFPLLPSICYHMSNTSIQFQDPVSKHWPEFAAAGKASTTIAHVLSHSWGMQSLDGRPVSLPHAIEGTLDGSCEVSLTG